MGITSRHLLFIILIGVCVSDFYNYWWEMCYQISTIIIRGYVCQISTIIGGCVYQITEGMCISDFYYPTSRGLRGLR